MIKVELGFVPAPITFAINRVLPSRKTRVGLATSRKFKQIRSSIEDVGLIEPLTVVAIPGDAERHMLLDGHMRLIALRELGFADVQCLVVRDDEAYRREARTARPVGGDKAG